MSSLQQHQSFLSMSSQEDAQMAADVISAVTDLLEAFNRLQKSNIGSVVLVRIGSMLANAGLHDNEIAEDMSTLLKTTIGSYCDPDITSSESDSETLAYISMMNSPVKMFEIITRELRPHYSKCRLLTMYEHSSDMCGCVSKFKTPMVRYGLNVCQYTWIYGISQ